MISFESDYINGAHPRLLERLIQTNLVTQSGYGADEYCAAAKEKIQKACGKTPVDVEFLVGGTQTNAFVISTLLREHEGVIAAATGHVNLHEAGAIEYTGHKVIALPHENGKLSAAAVRAFCQDFYADASREMMTFPGMVYISFPTEYGTLYTKQELTRLRQVCREYDMPLYLDGARLGYGLMSHSCDVTLEDLAELCDVFYIGGTKVGALCGEALVFQKGRKPAHFVNAKKKRGALLAKGRLLGVQFDELFTDGLYFEISRHAIEMAEELKSIFREKGYRLFMDSPTNQQFVILPNALMEELSKKVGFCYWERYDEAHTVVRFASSWATTGEELDYLRSVLPKL